MQIASTVLPALLAATEQATVAVQQVRPSSCQHPMAASVAAAWIEATPTTQDQIAFQ